MAWGHTPSALVQPAPAGVRMVCQMELASHLLTAGIFDSVAENEMPLVALIKQLTLLPAVSPGRVPAVIKYLTEMAPTFILPHRGEHSYPRAVKRKPQKYPTLKPTNINAGQLN